IAASRSKSYETIGVWSRVGQAGVLSPTNFPHTFLFAQYQKLPATHDLIWRSFVAGKCAAEPHNGRVGADERELLNSFVLNTIAKERLVDRIVTALDRVFSAPNVTRPQNPNTLLAT